MTTERQLLLMLRGGISELPAEEQDRFHAVTEQLRQILRGLKPDFVAAAVSLLAAEIAVATQEGKPWPPTTN